MTMPIRRRQVCGACDGTGVIDNPEPKPSKWFSRMGLTYVPGVEFVVSRMPHPDRCTGDMEWQVSYNDVVTDDNLFDDEAQFQSEEYNDQLQHDLQGEYPCRWCKSVGTVPQPLAPDDQVYDRGELMAEAFGRGGMQGYNDQADEWSEYVSGTGAYADPLQKSIDRAWETARLNRLSAQDLADLRDNALMGYGDYDY